MAGGSGLIILGKEDPKKPEERPAGTPPPTPGLTTIETEDKPPSTSRTGAFTVGAAQGATLSASDEAQAMIQAAASRREGESMADAYNRVMAELKTQRETMAKEHPVAYYGGQLAGAAVTAIPTAGGRLTSAGIGAATGAAEGALSGDSTSERIGGAAFGAAGGAAGGLISPEIGKLTAAASAKIGRPVGAFIGSLIGLPGGRQQVAQALKQAGLSPAEIEALIDDAAKRGQNLTLGDVSDRPGARLTQQAGATNPEAQMIVQDTVNERAGERVDRFRNYLSNVSPGYGHVASERNALLDAARNANRGAYKAAYTAHPSLSLDPEFQDLLSSPVVQKAIRDVEEKSANRAVAGGGASTIKNPFQVDPQTGQMTLKPGVTPSLEFWDQVQRNLREAGESAGKGFFPGTKSSEATDIEGIRRRLNTHLDTLSPEFKAARGGAAAHFNASDALDLGVRLASDSGMSAEAFQRGVAELQKLSGAERRLAQLGYMDALSHKAGNVTAGGDFTRNLIGSENDRLVQRALFGPEKAAQIEAFQKAEGLMQVFANRTLGGSPTQERISDALKRLGVPGIAGSLGGTALGAYQGDQSEMGKGGLAAAGGLAGLIFAGGKGAISNKVALQVAKSMTSTDPAERQAVYRYLQNSPQIRDAVSAIATRLGGLLASEAAPEEEPR